MDMFKGFFSQMELVPHAAVQAEVAKYHQLDEASKARAYWSLKRMQAFSDSLDDVLTVFHELNSQDLVGANILFVLSVCRFRLNDSAGCLALLDQIDMDDVRLPHAVKVFNRLITWKLKTPAYQKCAVASVLGTLAVGGCLLVGPSLVKGLKSLAGHLTVEAEKGKVGVVLKF